MNHQLPPGESVEVKRSLLCPLPAPYRDVLAVGSLILIVALVMREFWRPGIASAADMLMGIYRVFELREALANGVLYPRIGSNFSFGYGSPLFQFYPPLVSYVALVFHWAGIGLINASKAAFTLSLGLGAIGTYVFAQSTFRKRLPAFVAGVMVALSPYLILVAYERGAAAEGLALGITPWVFWSFQRAARRGRITDVLVGGMCLALLVLAHNITALFVLPAVLAYTAVVGFAQLRATHWLALVGALLLGLGLSAFYWLPAVREVHYTWAQIRMLGGQRGVAQLVSGWSNLVQTSLFFDYWGEARFRVAWWQLLLVTMGGLTIPLQKNVSRLALATLTAIWVTILVIQMDVTKAFWETVPLIQFIQFPWRMLGLASFITAVMTAALLCLIERAPILQKSAAAILLLAVALFLTWNLNVANSLIWYQISDEDLGYVDMYERGRAGFSLFSDYGPRNPGARDVAEAPLPAEPPSIAMTGAGYEGVDLAVEASTPFRLRYHQVFFPGWQINVDARPVETFADTGSEVVAADLPAGRYNITIRFEQTLLRTTGDLLSILALVLFAIGLGTILPTRALWVRSLPVLLVAGGIAIVHEPWLDTSHISTIEPLNFEGKLSLLAYRLDDHAWQSGDTVTLRLYWLTHQAEQNYKIFLHLVTMGDERIVAQFDSEPILGFSPTSQWNPGEIVADRYNLVLEDDIAPGEYQLIMGVYQLEPLQNLRVPEAPNVLPGDRVVLTQIEINE